MSQSKRLFFTLFLNTSFLLLFCVFLALHFESSEHVFLRNKTNNKVKNKNFIFSVSDDIDEDCKSFHSLSDYKAKCFYLKSNNPCVSQGYVDYLYLFYCKIGNFPFLGHTLLFLWLLVLFYLLANTASEYFCPSLDNLSKVLRLSPTIAGVTLLSLGNGANDVFATFVSFKGSGTQDIGFNTVLGGGSFVSCVVVGIISISVRHKGIRVKKSALIRDVCFLLFVLVCLFTIFISGEINVFVAIGFCLMYVVYVGVVYVSSSKRKGVCDEDAETETDYDDSRNGNCNDLGVPLLGYMEKGMINGAEECEFRIEKNCCNEKSSFCRILVYVLNMPLYLPRRLTIPVICEEKWSKLYAVSSAILSPLLLAFLWIPNNESFSSSSSLIVYGIGLLIGIILGVIAIITTESSNPPKKYLLPWLVAGFVMSVTWSYISAQELVGLLVSLGFICGVNPSILGLTVLAWGNSIGDLVTNLTMALNGGPEGVQIAISGCYAGPIFNTVIGLGLSLVTTTWCEYPSSIEIPKDPYLWETLAFLVIGLIWALVVLIRRDMKLDAMLGGGLLAIYFVSLILRLIQTLGSLQFKDMLV
ncbi:cation/calcium exchanger 2-like protein [Trifolium pratense]|uniref:Cation/calcium exchanger 2-like protein n=1 Tax=Trifolium pratense TaxID=57577 RepID=A0A2K3NKE9_TRIPR|nr:cation/calcium exchanger 2-like protein [Trifolium pratense]